MFCANLRRCQALDHFLVDPQTLTITAFLDYDMSHIAHPIHEFFHSFYDLCSFPPGPYVNNPQNLVMHRALLYGFPDPLPEPAKGGKTASPKYGSGAGIDWKLSHMWAEELNKAGALRPARMGPQADEITALYWFVQDICPPYLLLQPTQKAEQAQVMYKEKGGILLMKYLERWAY
jgi:hypothetical protein